MARGRANHVPSSPGEQTIKPTNNWLWLRSFQERYQQPQQDILFLHSKPWSDEGRCILLWLFWRVENGPDKSMTIGIGASGTRCVVAEERSSRDSERRRSFVSFFVNPSAYIYGYIMAKDGSYLSVYNKRECRGEKPESPYYCINSENDWCPQTSPSCVLYAKTLIPPSRRKDRTTNPQWKNWL